MGEGVSPTVYSCRYGRMKADSGERSLSRNFAGARAGRDRQIVSEIGTHA